MEKSRPIIQYLGLKFGKTSKRNGKTKNITRAELPFTLAREPPWRRAVLATNMYGEHSSPLRIRTKRLEA
jgi:hypothetical protein